MCPWLLAFWAALGDVFIGDWDESNAFCNIPRESCDELMGDDTPGLGEWLRQFYDALEVYVMTPFGMTDAYRMRHGGAQGDSMGVGTHGAVGIRRTEFHLGVLRQGYFPEDLSSGAPAMSSICLYAPYDSSIPVPEVVYSDDRRFFARTAAGLARTQALIIKSQVDDQSQDAAHLLHGLAYI